MKNKKNQGKIFFLILLLLTGFLFFYNLGNHSLWDADEPIYTEIAREMTVTGDWLTLHLNNERWFCHPPLYMWLTAITSNIFGWSEFAARFWSALFGLMIIMLVFLLGRALYNSEAAFWGGVFLLTSLQFFIHSRLAHLDTAFVFFMTLSLYFFWLGYKHNEKFYWAMWLSMGGATLAKGPAGLVLPGVVILLFLLLARDLGRLRRMKFISGIFIYLMIGAPWYVAESIINGRKFIDMVFLFFTIERVLKPIMNQSGPWWYYFACYIPGFFPWIVLLPGSFWYFKIDKENRKPSLLLLVWILFSFVFFSLVQTKLPNYILFIYPPSALLVSHFWSSFLSGVNSEKIKRKMRKHIIFAALVLIIFSTFLVIAFIILAQKKYPVEFIQSSQYLWMLGSTLLVFPIIAFILFFRKQSFFAPIISFMMILIFLQIVHLLPVIVDKPFYKPIKHIALKIKSIIKPEDKLATPFRGGSILFYSGHHVIYLKGIKMQADFLSSSERVFLVTSQDDLVRIKKIIKFPLYIFYFENLAQTVLVSNRPIP